MSRNAQIVAALEQQIKMLTDGTLPTVDADEAAKVDPTLREKNKRRAAAKAARNAKAYDYVEPLGLDD